MDNLTTIPDQRGWVLYDGDCHLCISLAARFDRLGKRAGFALLPLQSETGQALLREREGDLLREMAVVTVDGRIFGGAEACLFLARHFWWTRPLGAVAALPGGRWLCDLLYRWIAANRHCYGGACARGRSVAPRIFATIAMILPLVAFAATRTMEPWIMMWALATGIFFSCKLLMLARHFPVERYLRGTLAYLLFWPGMNPRPFLHPMPRPERPRFREFFQATAKLLGGVVLLWIVVPAVGAEQPLVTGWLGMIGLILVLHFGLFHLLALFWQWRGVSVRPIMNAPFRATSLTEFWGERWNRAFSDLARDLVYRPLWRRLGPAACTTLVFLISGVVHDLVISVPARGGYGLPTLFFLIQGLAILTERTGSGKRIGLGGGQRGRIFVLMVLGAPLFGLFHPAFVYQVMLPFLETIKCL